MSLHTSVEIGKAFVLHVESDGFGTWLRVKATEATKPVFEARLDADAAKHLGSALVEAARIARKNGG